MKLIARAHLQAPHRTSLRERSVVSKTKASSHFFGNTFPQLEASANLPHQIKTDTADLALCVMVSLRSVGADFVTQSFSTVFIINKNLHAGDQTINQKRAATRSCCCYLVFSRDKRMHEDHEAGKLPIF